MWVLGAVGTPATQPPDGGGGQRAGAEDGSGNANGRDFCGVKQRKLSDFLPEFTPHSFPLKSILTDNMPKSYIMFLALIFLV
jgi:hypothetical protein